MYSQSNEDVIIKSIFRRIGDGGKRFVEFGCGKGNQNNTINLLMNGWSGLWCEIRKKCYQSARSMWHTEIERGQLEIRRYRAIPEKINSIVKDPLDFLSIDIDGNDYAVWKAITARPRVVCIEYDALHGTPLVEMIALGDEKGYTMTEISASEVNAFFVVREEWNPQ